MAGAGNFSRSSANIQTDDIFPESEDSRIFHSRYNPGSWPGDIDSAAIERLESLGLESSQTYGPDIWLSLNRDLVSYIIKRHPSSPSHPFIRDTSIKIMTTGGRSDLLQRSSPPVKGEDFLTLRLKKLNDLGAFEHASEIYRQMRDIPYHPDLVFAGVTAFLGAGENEEACLEIWAFERFLEDNDLWGDLVNYCNATFRGDGVSRSIDDSIGATVSDRIARDDTVEINYDDILNTPLARLMILHETGRLSVVTQAREVRLNTVALSKINFLSQHVDDLPKALRSAFTLQKYMLGDVPLKELKKTYQEIGRAFGTSPMEELRQLPVHMYIPALYQRYILNDPTLSRSKILSILSRESERTHIEALHPFLDLIDIELLSALPESEQYPFLLASTTHSDRPEWINGYVRKILSRPYGEQSDSESVNNLKLKDVLKLSLAHAITNTHTKDASLIYLNTAHKTLENIIENRLNGSNLSIFQKMSGIIINLLLDKKSEKSHIPIHVYEKHLVLTTHINYVIKSMDVKKQLDSAALQRSESQVLALILMMIGDTSLHQLKPEILYIAVTTMVEVGLADQAQEIFLSAINGQH